ncbi:MAG: hypothetical protein ACI808_001335 [Paraglaciecola sp.]|jgi:hypothetical protein
MEQSTGIFSRISMAFKLIFSQQYAISLLSTSEQIKTEVEQVDEKPELDLTEPQSALQLLSVMQKEGRLIDFINQEVNDFSDDQVAAAARVVHAGVKSAITQYVQFAPVSESPEGETISLAEDFDKNEYRLTGNIVGTGPFSGTLVHKGWKVTSLNFPLLAKNTDLHVVAPAEVEL